MAPVYYSMVVDSRYTEGVWYDMHNGDFARVMQQREGAALATPDGSDVFHEWEDNEEAQSELQSDFVQVPQEAVENPATYVQNCIDEVLMVGDITAALSHEERRGLSYARQQVEIQESE